MHSRVLFSIVTSVLVTALNAQAQVPLASTPQDDYPDGTCSTGDRTEWSLDESPSPNATDHLVFDTVYSLLQQWPNTRLRNGHTIVPGVIPKGTLLYHGTIHKRVPPGPEWVSVDPEYAHYCCWDIPSNMPTFQDKCWYLTLVTTRPIKIIYFDGSSAALFPNGSLDSQDLVIWGKPGPLFDEYRRVDDLCEWVQKFGVDGIVRMGINFEVMLCDFTSGVSKVSFVNLEPPEGVPPLIWGPEFLELVNSNNRHNRFPGETRIQLDLARLVSFYDTRLAPSLILIRAGQERWYHRLKSISKEDLSAVKSRLEAVMAKPWGSQSGIDWKTHVQVIVEQFAQRLGLIRHLLNSPTASPEETIDLANKTQAQLRNMLTPYIVLSAKPFDCDSSDKTDLDWSIPIYKLCATTHTYPMESDVVFMTVSEKLIFGAVRGTVREICRVVTKMWATGVYAGLDSSLNTKEDLDIPEIHRVRDNWAGNLDHLMGWLDWSVWVKCSPECGPEELCYLPTWPIDFPYFGINPADLWSRRVRPGTTGFESRTVDMPEDEWMRPRPKCVRRFAPYEY